MRIQHYEGTSRKPFGGPMEDVKRRFHIHGDWELKKWKTHFITF